MAKVAKVVAPIAMSLAIDKDVEEISLEQAFEVINVNYVKKLL